MRELVFFKIEEVQQEMFKRSLRQTLERIKEKMCN